MIKKTLSVLLLVLVLGLALLFSLGAGWFGSNENAGTPQAERVPQRVLDKRLQRQQAAAGAASKQILFGDFHVHSTFSYDAFVSSLPIAGGDIGPHTVADACDFARYCSALDFWSINDHAEQISPRLWRETVESVSQCNALAGSRDNPDLVTFLGWEWTQTGPTAALHFGHKNVILKDLETIPERPIAAPGQGAPLPPLLARGMMALATRDSRTLDLNRYLAELDAAEAVKEVAHDPNELFSKLDDWGLDALVIPHGTSWGIYTPPVYDWRKQLEQYHDPDRQTLVEVYSGHGNSERWIDNQAWLQDANGGRVCPPETASYLPGCQQAGRIIFQRCMQESMHADCDLRAAQARQNYVDANMAGPVTVPGVDMWTEWKDSAQCRDCFLPAFNYRRGGSVQYMLAMTDFSNPAQPRRLDFGFIAASDNHSAKPGTGYKEFSLSRTTDARYYLHAVRGLMGGGEPLAQSQEINWEDVAETALKEPERFNSFWYSGGLVALHSESRRRTDIWDALQRKETYGTSGPRILLWFDLLEGESVQPMGSSVERGANPSFTVRAVGSFEQKPGCPSHATEAAGRERLEALCQNECYNPSDRRRRIERIEIVRIRPQQHQGEAIDPLIEDAWRVAECPEDELACEFTFTDTDYADTARDTIYYARAIESAIPTLNGANLGCEYNEQGVCISMRDCGNNPATPGDCLAPVQHRAWSSPIFVNYRADQLQ